MKTHTADLPFNILLADDDTDDCFFFEKALKALPIEVNFNKVHNGEDLMTYLLLNIAQLPNIIFLDLSMPRKTGFECLTEINESETLKNIPVIVFTTSYSRGIDFELNLKNTLLSIGAREYIKKPSDFEELKQIIQSILAKYVSIERIKNADLNKGLEFVSSNLDKKE